MRLIAALVATTLLLVGCGGSSDDTSPDATQSTPFDRERLDRQADEQSEQVRRARKELADQVADDAARLRGVVVAIDIKDGKATVQGERVDVKVGQKVFLDITSDVVEEIHVHSDPEHTYQVEAGDSITETLTIDRPGQVAVEAHHLGVTIVQLVVTS